MIGSLRFNPEQQSLTTDLLAPLKDASDDKLVGMLKGKLIVLYPDTPITNQRCTEKLCKALNIPFEDTITLRDLREKIKQVEPTLYIGADQSATADPSKKPPQTSGTSIASTLINEFDLPHSDKNEKTLNFLFSRQEDHLKGQLALKLWKHCCEQTQQALPPHLFLMALNKLQLLDKEHLQGFVTDMDNSDPAKFKKAMTPVLRRTFLTNSQLLPLSDAAKQELKDDSLWSEPLLYTRLDKLRCFRKLLIPIKNAAPDTRIQDTCFKLLLGDIDTNLITTQVNAISQDASTENTVLTLNTISQQKTQGSHFQPHPKEPSDFSEKEIPDDPNLLCPLTTRQFKKGQLQHYRFYTDHISYYPGDVARAIPMPYSDKDSADDWSKQLENDKALNDAFIKAKNEGENEGEFLTFKDFNSFIKKLHQIYDDHWCPSKLENDIEKNIALAAADVINDEKSLATLASLTANLLFPKVSKDKLNEVIGENMSKITQIWKKQAKVSDLPVDIDFSNGADCVLPTPEQGQHIPLSENYTGIFALDQSGKEISKNRTTSIPVCYWLYSFPEGHIQHYQKFHQSVKTGSKSSVAYALSHAKVAKGIVIQLFPKNDKP